MAFSDLNFFWFCCLWGLFVWFRGVFFGFVLDVLVVGWVVVGGFGFGMIFLWCVFWCVFFFICVGFGVFLLYIFCCCFFIPANLRPKKPSVGLGFRFAFSALLAV